MPWKKGQSGNPAGRPKKGDTFRDLLEAVLEERKRYNLDNGRYILPKKKELIARVLIDRALEGDGQMMREFLNRYIGLPVQQIDLEAMLDVPVPINIIMHPDGIDDNAGNDPGEKGS